MCVEIDECIFDTREVSFVGFILSGSGIRMDPEKSKSIVDWPKPTNKKEVQ